MMRSPDPNQRTSHGSRHRRGGPSGGHTGGSSTSTSTAHASRRRRAIALAAFVFVGTCAVLTTTAPASHAADADYLSRINALRASRGLNALAFDGNMDSLAIQHTQEMAARQTLVHTSNLKANVTSNWTKVGENVGVGGNNNQIWEAFLASPKHFANLVDPAFTHVGIGVVVDSAGSQWTTHRFVAIAAAAPVTEAPAPVVTSPPVTRPPVTAPPVTAPRPVVTSPPTTLPPTPPTTTAGEGGGDGGTDGAGGGPNDLRTSDVPASPARVGSVIDSLRALN